MVDDLSRINNARMLSEAWFTPGVGYVLYGDAEYASDWCREMQCHPALCVADPWYGDIVGKRDIADIPKWLRILDGLAGFGCPVYWWGGIGKPGARYFLEFALRLERETRWRIRDWITWRKRRAYGKPKDYLFVREECLLLTIDGDAPETFNIPYSDQKRGYEGYNENYPAKSEYLRITNVWDDTEILRGKVHMCQKAPAVCRRPIEVHTKPGDLVLDLFSGSGETSLQAIYSGRCFISVERDKETCELICSRLETAITGGLATDS